MYFSGCFPKAWVSGKCTVKKSISNFLYSFPTDHSHKQVINLTQQDCYVHISTVNNFCLCTQQCRHSDSETSKKSTPHLLSLAEYLTLHSQQTRHQAEHLVVFTGLDFFVCMFAFWVFLNEKTSSWLLFCNFSEMPLPLIKFNFSLL